MLKLPGIRNKKEEVEYFLSLIIAPHKTAAILFEKKNKMLSILSFQEALFARVLDDISEDDLIASCDQVVSGLDAALPQGAELKKTIFALPFTWVENGKVSKTKLDFLKKLCEELDLTPIGFLVPIEAIVAHLQRQEGAPLSAVVVEHSKEIAIVYVIKGGQILEIKKGTLGEGTLTAAVEKLLAGVTKVDVLPSKIILQDADNVAELQQEFLSYHWTQRLPFLHVPQVTILEKGIENDAIINGVSSQMGFEVASVAPIAAAAVHTHGDTRDQNSEPGDSTPEPGDHEDVGFYKEQDVADMEPETTPAQPIEKNVHVNVEPVAHENGVSEGAAYDDTKGGATAASAGGGIFDNLKSMVPSFHFAKNIPFSPKLLIPIAVILVLLGGFVYLYYQVLLKANVVIASDRKTIQEQVPVVLSAETSTSAKDGTIKLLTKSIEVSGDATTEATGEEETGKKAAGTITLYNKTEQKKTFSKGAKVIGSNNLEFVLAEDVNIASTAAFSTSYANVKGKVEAGKFGKEYNLPSNTNFTIDGLASANFFGKNDEAFAGGSKEVNQVVSSKDLDTLEEKLIKGLEVKALEQAKSQMSEKDVMLDGFISTKLVDKKFDRKEKEKAKSVKLVGKVAYEIGYYNTADIASFANDYAKDDIPAGFTIRENESDFELKNLETDAKTGETEATLDMRAVYLPQIPKDQIGPQVKGASTSTAIEKVKKIDGVENVTVEFSRQIPFLPKILPMNLKNIIITVQDEH